MPHLGWPISSRHPWVHGRRVSLAWGIAILLRVQLNSLPSLHLEVHFSINLLNCLILGLFLGILIKLSHVVLKFLMVSFLFSFTFWNKFAFVILDGIHSFQVVFMYILHVIVFAFAKARWLEPWSCYRAINPCPIGGINALGKEPAPTAPPLAFKRLL